VVYRPAIVNLQEKSNFLNSADYFLHARRRGESFGMAILESIACGLPTFAWSGGKDQHHTFLLGKDSLYDSQEDLLMKISNLANYKDISRNSDKSKEFLPGPVISKFIAVFIKPLLMEGGSLLHPYEI
jgi:glycosyltransferase involved in cell wall biosynthesis